MLVDALQQVVDQGSITLSHEVPQVAANRLRGNEATVDGNDAHMLATTE